MDRRTSRSIIFHRSQQSDITRDPAAHGVASSGSSRARGMRLSQHGSHKTICTTENIEMAPPSSGVHSGELRIPFSDSGIY